MKWNNFFSLVYTYICIYFILIVIQVLLPSVMEFKSQEGIECIGFKLATSWSWTSILHLEHGASSFQSALLANMRVSLKYVRQDLVYTRLGCLLFSYIMYAISLVKFTLEGVGTCLELSNFSWSWKSEARRN